MHVLVSGGAGFVGSHICDALMREGHDVHVLDDGSAGVDLCPKGVRTRESRSLISTYRVPRVEAVVHCAARADVKDNWTSIGERTRMWNSNIAGTTTLLEAIRGSCGADVPVTFISTCAVYGDNENAYEDAACYATSPYAASKLAGEALVQAYAHASSVGWHALRLSCVVGSRYHHGHVRDFVDGTRVGTLRPLTDGWGKKSFIHVRDVADCVAMCVGRQIPAGTYNVASGNWCPRDTVREMGPIDVEWPEQLSHGWIGDPMAIGNATKLRNAGWIAKRSIRDGVREALAGLGWNP